ncbi:MAG: signal peptide peptidase SppA [Candidatus Woesearchaeota archaeon]
MSDDILKRNFKPIKKKTPKVDLILEDKIEIASPLKRFLAFVIDLFIIQILLIPFSNYIEKNLTFTTDFSKNISLLESNPELLSSLSFFVFMVFLILFFYFVYFEYKLGQTPGKLILGIRVINYSLEKNASKKANESEKLNFLQSVMRNLFFIPLFPFYLLWFIDPIYLIFTQKRLSDNFSKTIVVNSKEPITKENILLVLKISSIIFLFIIILSYIFPYLTDLPQTTYGKNVAIIPIHGTISVSEGDMFSSGVVSSESVISKLDKVLKNKEIKAVIFDINSPGGSPVPTDEISQKIKELKKYNITTIALIREYGASGAYWIASSCDYIFANRMSLVGSIGVIGSYLDFSGLLQRYNITYQRYVSGELKDMGSPFKPASEEEKKVFQKLIDDLNEIFIEEVSLNRNLSIEDVRKLATGQVYLGIEAKKLKLIDEIGTKQDAINFIEKNLNINANVIEYKDTKSIFDSLLASKSKLGNFIYPILPTIN